MSNDYPDMPAFLKIPQDERRALWKGRRLTRQGSRFNINPKREDEPATRALRRELERQEAEKKARRLEALKEWKAKNK